MIYQKERCFLIILIKEMETYLTFEEQCDCKMGI